MNLLYKTLLRPLLFSIPAEKAHHLAIEGLRLSQKTKTLAGLKKLCQFDHPLLHLERFGLHFKNPIGLAAGFDKNAELAHLLPAIGFSHLELGTVTRYPQPGNDPPRLFRLPKDRALINRMGFNNLGAQAVKKSFSELKSAGLPEGVVYGINIGKNKNTPPEKAAEEYAVTFGSLAPLAHYVAINVSSPNTPGLRDLQGKAALAKILDAIAAKNANRTPVLLKISPDLSLPQLDDVIELAIGKGLAGLIATNTTLSREGLSPHRAQSGGLSGAPLKEKSTEVIRHIRRQTNGKLTIIGVGGIFSTEDAYEKIRAGASLVQVYTGFIYEGPLLIKQISKGLVKLLSRDGFRSIDEAVGTGV